MSYAIDLKCLFLVKEEQIGMKKGVLSLILLILVGSVFITVGILIAADVPEEVVIENRVYKRDKKSAVTFSHLEHSNDYQVQCTECHHDYQDGKNVWKEGDPVKKCIECHDSKGKNRDKPQGLRYAYHDNCHDCHDELRRNGNKEVPKKTKCANCHER